MTPPTPSATMARAAIWPRMKDARRLMPTTRSHSARDISRNGTTRSAPTLLTRMSSRPAVEISKSAAAWQLSVEVTSPVNGTARAPATSTSLATCLRLSLSRSNKHRTADPSSANLLAVARPTPLAAPVISALLPSSLRHHIVAFSLAASSRLVGSPSAEDPSWPFDVFGVAQHQPGGRRRVGECRRVGAKAASDLGTQGLLEGSFRREAEDADPVRAVIVGRGRHEVRADHPRQFQRHSPMLSEPDPQEFCPSQVRAALHHDAIVPAGATHRSDTRS